MTVTVHVMRIVTSTDRSTIGAQRDPATGLYERACDLIEAAVDALRRAGSACGSARASAGPLLAGLTVL
jgi:hypothetical protein